MNTFAPVARAAIETKYIPCTNYRGSRIKAISQAGSVTISYPHELSGAEAHWAAVTALMEKNPAIRNWANKWTCGALHNATGYVFTPIHEKANVIEVTP